jgi:glycerol dehydrogenase
MVTLPIILGKMLNRSVIGLAARKRTLILIRTAVFPRRYVQGRGALALFGKEAAKLGQRIFCLVDSFAEHEVRARIGTTEGIELIIQPFTGHCTRTELDHVLALMRGAEADVVAGFGGGSVIDVARAAAAELKLPFMSVATIAASDAPVSGISILYDDKGVMLGRINVKNPDVVIVDTAMIVAAPVRFFVAGIGDGLATWYEAESCRQAFAGNVAKEQGAALAHATATLCRDTILAHGRQAVRDCAAHLATPDVEAVLEATVLMSGVGFESGGVAAAHAIHNGLTEIPGTRPYLHGEKVGFGLLASLFLSQKPDALRCELFSFCADVGLPVRLHQIGFDVMNAADLALVGERTCKPGSNIHNEPFDVSPEDIVIALKAADAYGVAYEKANS